jgi:plastocyanin
MSNFCHCLPLLAVAAFAGACDEAGEARTAYTPHVRDITITTVPLLVKEQASTLPFLKRDFAKGGVLDGKEVYAFDPNTITVIVGDTLDLTFVNPEDDDHAFALHDLLVKLPGQAITKARYVARAAGIYDFSCTVPAHTPMMRGQLIVLRAGG